ncbi:glycoside hydrolase family 3 C-terminal domain-containing protein [Chitinophagaceae bacterium LB-8]|uniref:beta-glucosidase n=1 Tax=Paraflavisolibacter caeni TaxID=2982496 RepID=A0A9X2XWQ1_9BACT|nr:glycoside hydrolase family 3 N-terminal domain-containing protein [Paraflavisolibacter caeni]MCU7550470.1 glycoside hydrolase family 3 C-terminal domain-containing protein [Paraflavisolibacter caeni]
MTSTSFKGVHKTLHFKIFTHSLTSIAIILLLYNHTSAQLNGKTKDQQPLLGYRTAKILTVNGLKFKDLNKNGRLDRYEDWRLSNEERSQDLLSKMSLEEKVGFMLISTTRLKNDWSFEAPKNKEPITSDFNEEDLVTTTNMFTHKSLPVPIMTAAGTTKAVTQFHLRHFILRANVSARILAEWGNKLQALCESDGLGIPAIVASNPRNHITKDASIGLSVGKTAFSTWPGELGLSAMRDLGLVREFANIARQEWAATGLRKGYMYMADLSTEPRWQRIEGTFGENAEWVAKMTTEIVIGFQGAKLNPTSVALTTKHFPGGGAGEGGQDPHFEWGKYETFPGGMFENNLIPFKAAIKAGTSSIMPYYSVPKDTKYEKIAYAYNKVVIRDLLRDKLGFEGIINSDTGPIEMMPWGAENLSITERYKRTLEAGVNLYSGTADPAKLLETVKSGLVNRKLIDESVHKLLIEKFALGLFENPYVDEEAAERIAGNAKFQERASLAMRKSIVLLRNETKVLPLKPRTKVYFETYLQRKGIPSPGNIYSANADNYNVQFVNKPEEADVILLWITPGTKSLFESDGSPLYLSLSKNAVDVGYVNSLTAKKPTILAINYTNPWVIDEIYNDAMKSNIKGVLATFGTSTDALLDVVTGKFNPTGKMPFTTPVSEKAVQTQKTDVPGYMEGPNYGLFQYDEGLSYE